MGGRTSLVSCGEVYGAECLRSANLVLGILREHELSFGLPGNSVSDLFERFIGPCAVAGARTTRRVGDPQCGFTLGTPGARYVPSR
jgi:hypothetical protein